MDAGKHVIAELLDFQNVVDYVEHNLLVYKLEKYGESRIILKLSESYISDRVQYTATKNSQSCMLPITYGVPQG